MGWSKEQPIRTFFSPCLINAPKVMDEDNSYNGWSLSPLIPQYIDEEHSHYSQTILNTLNNTKIRNIALSGNYGVGKSSILHYVATKLEKRTVELSLSTLAPIEKTFLDESLPKQATTPTNRIQQEIVKQLLYREDPHQTPGSRFRRIESINFLRELSFSAFLATIIVFTFLLTGWTETIESELPKNLALGGWVHAFVFGLSACLILVARYFMHGKIHLREITAGTATVTLDDKSVSYFDQYLDEIVYFFEKSNRDIVIFEDIDRFNDPYIFETLRALNTLLNSAPQIKSTIRFIYAIKDSIFDSYELEISRTRPQVRTKNGVDHAKNEVFRANRTKFFDLVIPVVPFITHLSARNLASQLLNNIEHQVDFDLIDLASRYVPDMRLLKNVCNEFIVFRDRIFSGDGQNLNLSETELFAMMLYKSTHLSDFEAIRLGNSNLDKLYLTARRLISTNLKKTESEIISLERQLDKLNTVSQRSEELGVKLIEFIKIMVNSIQANIGNSTLKLSGRTVNFDDLRNKEFWLEIINSSDGEVLRWNDRFGHSISFSRSDLESILSCKLTHNEWNASEKQELTDTLEELKGQLSYLKSADMEQLISSPGFRVNFEDNELSFDEVVQCLLGNGLAYHLTRAGYINRNFTLYTSTFHGNRLSSAATNFLIHHVERDNMDEHFALQPDEVEAILRDLGKKALSEPATYNISILDYLLETDQSAVQIMLSSLKRFDELSMRFLQAYLTNSKYYLLFVSHLTAVSPRILNYLVNDVELDDEKRLACINAALENLAAGIEYKTSTALFEYLESRYAEMSVLVSSEHSEEQISRVAQIISKSDFVPSSLKPLSLTSRKVFITRSLYKINYENLCIALGSKNHLSMDRAYSIDSVIYTHILNHIGDYISAIENKSETIEYPDNFINIIEDVIAKNKGQVEAVIKNASAQCRVEDIESISVEAWPALAGNKRFPVTFSNVRNYIDSIGLIDENLALSLISSEQITTTIGASEDDKQALAKCILSSTEQLPSPSIRVSLVSSLNLDEYIDVSEIEPESGELFSLLIKHNIIEDTSDTYYRLLHQEWGTKELFILSSPNFEQFMTPSLVEPDLLNILSSDKIAFSIKRKLIANANEYFENSNDEELLLLASFVIKNGFGLSIECIRKMALSHISSKHIIHLLEPHLDTVSREVLIEILDSLDGDYPKLAYLGADVPKLPNTDQDKKLITKLKLLGIVSKSEVNNNKLIIYKKRK